MTAPAATPTTLAAPALLNTGSDPDWPVLVRSLLAYRDWVLTVHPDPALVDSFLDPSYSVTNAQTGVATTFATMHADVASLARGDVRWDPPGDPATATIVTMQNRDANAASVFVRFPAMKGGRIVGRDGQVTQYPDVAGSASVWRLVLNPDGRWKLAGVKPQ